MRALEWLLEHFYTVTFSGMSLLLMFVVLSTSFENYSALRHKWQAWLRIPPILLFLALLWAVVWLTPLTVPRPWVPRLHYIYKVEVRP